MSPLSYNNYVSFKPSRQLLFFPSQVHFRGIVMLKRGIELLVLSVKISCKFWASAATAIWASKHEKFQNENRKSEHNENIFAHIRLRTLLHYTRNREAISGDGKYLKSAKKKFFNEKRMKLLCVIWDFSSAW